MRNGPMVLVQDFALSDFAPAAAVVAAAPVIQQCRRPARVVVEVSGKFDLGRPAAQVFDGGINEPKADVYFLYWTSRRRECSNWTAE